MSAEKGFEANQYPAHGSQQDMANPIVFNQYASNGSQQAMANPTIFNQYASNGSQQAMSYPPVTNQMPQAPQKESYQEAPPPYSPSGQYPTSSAASIPATQSGYPSSTATPENTKPYPDQPHVHHQDQMTNPTYPQPQGQMPMVQPQPMMYAPQQQQMQQTSNIIVTTQPQPGAIFVQPIQLEQNLLVPAILVTLFCFIPTGLAAIISANNANAAAATGDLHSSVYYTHRARLYIWMSIIFGICWIIAVIIGNSA